MQWSAPIFFVGFENQTLRLSLNSNDSNVYYFRRFKKHNWEKLGPSCTDQHFENINAVTINSYRIYF